MYTNLLLLYMSVISTHTEVDKETVKGGKREKGKETTATFLVFSLMLMVSWCNVNPVHHLS